MCWRQMSALAEQLQLCTEQHGGAMAGRPRLRKRLTKPKQSWQRNHGSGLLHTMVGVAACEDVIAAQQNPRSCSHNGVGSFAENR